MRALFEQYIDAKVVVVLESTGKVHSVESLLSDFGFSNFNVIATFGRLFDLPIDALGVNLEDLSQIKRVPINQNRIDYLSKLLADASLILVVTDDDIEGELIANDVFQIADLCGHRSEETVFRLRLKAIAFKQFIESLESASGINNEIVKGALARRTFDRICGYSISSNDYSTYNGMLHGRVGRVLTPLLSIVSKDDYDSQSFGYVSVIDDNNKTWHLEIFDNNKDFVVSKCNLLSSLKAPKIRKISSELVGDGALPMDFGSALSSLSMASGFSVARTSECLQDLYQSGAISYHRTDSRVISRSSAEEVGKVAFKHGVCGYSAESLMLAGGSLQGSSQNAHQAIVPLQDVASLHSNRMALSDQDFILMLIWRNIIRSGQTGREIEKHNAEIDFTDSIGKTWALHLEGVNYSISRSESFVSYNSSSRRLINDRVFVHGSDCTTKINERSGFYIEPNDHKVLRLMINNGLGRPSTFPLHASSVSRLFLDEYGRINSLGLSSLLLSKHFCSGLIDAEKSKQIERELHFGSENIQQRIMHALLMANIDISKGSSGSSRFSSEKDVNFIL